MSSEHRYDLGAGPAVRLTAQARPGIQSIVLQVTSLAQAGTFARTVGASTRMEDDKAILTLPQTNGLTLELRESPPAGAAAASV